MEWVDEYASNNVLIKAGGCNDVIVNYCHVDLTLSQQAKDGLRREALLHLFDDCWRVVLGVGFAQRANNDSAYGRCIFACGDSNQTVHLSDSFRVVA